jgi:VIT1/CCC1 family predicted Fe2+/Mn2+ transporter
VQIPANLAQDRRERTLGGVTSLAFALLIMPFIRGRKPWSAPLALILCSGFVAFLLGCSSSNGSPANPSKPAAQTYTLTVTGTAGADAHTTTLTLIVQ